MHGIGRVWSIRKEKRQKSRREVVYRQNSQVLAKIRPLFACCVGPGLLRQILYVHEAQEKIICKRKSEPS